MGTVVSEKIKKWQKAENNAIQTKGAGAFSEYLRLDCKPLAAGKYRIQWNTEARLQAGTTSLPKVRCNLDGVQIGVNVWKSPDTEWAGWSGWDFTQFSAGDTPAITLEVKRVGGTDTVEVKRLKVSIELME